MAIPFVFADVLRDIAWIELLARIVMSRERPTPWKKKNSKTKHNKSLIEFELGGSWILQVNPIGISAATLQSMGPDGGYDGDCGHQEWNV